MGEQAKVEVSPHVLRHSFGVELIDRGEDIRRVAELKGHSDMNTTMLSVKPGLRAYRNTKFKRYIWRSHTELYFCALETHRDGINVSDQNLPRYL